MTRKNYNYIWELLRFTMGFIILWAFFDKLIGLGFTTLPENAWIAGGSPTFGFLNFASKGIFSGFFNAISASPIIDWLFMAGLLLVGISLILGIFMKISSYSGAFMMFLMWLAVLPPEHHPFLDEHIIYILVLFGTAKYAGFWIGLRGRLKQFNIVKKFKFLE